MTALRLVRDLLLPTNDGRGRWRVVDADGQQVGFVGEWAADNFLAAANASGGEFEATWARRGFDSPQEALQGLAAYLEGEGAELASAAPGGVSCEQLDDNAVRVTIAGVGAVLIYRTLSKGEHGPVAGVRVVVDAEPGVPVEFG